MAQDALRKLGYIKTTWGWLLKTRVDYCKQKGLIATKPQLAFTHKATKSFNLGDLNGYLGGSENGFTD